MKDSQPDEVSTPVAPVKKVKLTPLESWIVLIGLVLGLGAIWTGCTALFKEDTPSAAKEQYDICMKVQMQEGDGVVKADYKCDYLKHQ